ncbi:hypothetical protein THAOC_36846, partial [Thalassiosira oceanica]
SPRHHEDLRRVRARAAGGLIQRGAAGTEAQLTAMCGVRGLGEPAGADEEGSHKVGGGRLPDLPPKKSQTLAMIQKRVAAGDPVAIWHLGAKYRFGANGLEKDVTRAVELYDRAAELGVKDAHFNLGVLYAKGADVAKDMVKAFRHYEAAAMCGHVPARYNLGYIEGKAGNHVIALQHLLISAKLGHEDSLNAVKRMFVAGLANEADYATALRGYQKALEEMSSPDRDEAKSIGTQSSRIGHFDQSIEKLRGEIENEQKSEEQKSRSAPSVLIETQRIRTSEALFALVIAATMSREGRLRRLTYMSAWDEGAPITEAFPNVVEKSTLVTRGNRRITNNYYLIKINGTEKLEILVGPFVDQLQDYFEAAGINGPERFKMMKEVLGGKAWIYYKSSSTILMAPMSATPTAPTLSMIAR